MGRCVSYIGMLIESFVFLAHDIGVCGKIRVRTFFLSALCLTASMSILSCVYYIHKVEDTVWTIRGSSEKSSVTMFEQQTDNTLIGLVQHSSRWSSLTQTKIIPSGLSCVETSALMGSFWVNGWSHPTPESWIKRLMAAIWKISDKYKAACKTVKDCVLNPLKPQSAGGRYVSQYQTHKRQDTSFPSRTLHCNKAINFTATPVVSGFEVVANWCVWMSVFEDLRTTLTLLHCSSQICGIFFFFFVVVFFS